MTVTEEKFYPTFELAQLRANYERTKDPSSLTKMMEIIKQDKMLFFYQDLIAKFPGIKADLTLIQSMKKDLDEKLAKIEEKLKDAEENAGDVEVKNAILDRAELYNTTGNKEESMKYYAEALKKTVGIGGKMDNILNQIRICLFFDDQIGVKEHIAVGHQELKKGADFERRNKLKVYEGVYELRNRDFKRAANLFLDSVATFTAVELMSMSDFVFYTVVVSMIGLTRSELKKKVLGSPEVLQVIHDRPHIREFLFAFYECEYRTWTREFVGVIDLLRNDRYFEPHLMYITKGLRLAAYKQFITAYKSVTIKMMADTFGVSTKFIDEEVYSFISQGKLGCQIDKVEGLIETIDTREGQKSLWYKDIIKEGDDLLNKMQKLAAAIAV